MMPSFLPAVFPLGGILTEDDELGAGNGLLATDEFIRCSRRPE